MYKFFTHVYYRKKRLKVGVVDDMNYKNFPNFGHSPGDINFISQESIDVIGDGDILISKTGDTIHDTTSVGWLSLNDVDEVFSTYYKYKKELRNKKIGDILGG